MRRLEGQRLGIGRYLEYLLLAWKDALQPDDRMSLYLREPLQRGRMDPGALRYAGALAAPYRCYLGVR